MVSRTVSHTGSDNEKNKRTKKTLCNWQLTIKDRIISKVQCSSTFSLFLVCFLLYFLTQLSTL